MNRNRALTFRVTPVLLALLVKTVLQGQEASLETEVCLGPW